jgi:hypothetical protein
LLGVTLCWGSCASHQASTDNLDNYQNKCLNIFNTAWFKYGLPAFLLMFGYAIYYLVGFFSGDEALVKEENTKTAQSAISNHQ